MSKFRKWLDKFNHPTLHGYVFTSKDFNDGAEAGWNAACKSILAKIRYKNRMFEDNWQHEDIDYLIEEIQEMVEKD